MSMKQQLAKVFGLSGSRDAKPPHYRAIAPGLIVTDTSAWAWFEIQPTNSDLLSESDRDAEQDRAGTALRALRGMDCHLRTMWGRMGGAEYLAGLPLADATAAQRAWAELRADSIDDLAVPTRKVLLGAKIETRRPRTAGGEAFGLIGAGIPPAELDRLTARVVQLGQQLKATVWRVRLASTETLAWAIAREAYRDTPVPREDLITGSPLARITTGRAQPMFDHLQMLDAHGQPAAFAAVLALTDFPEVIEAPGQEWIAVLNHLETNPTEDVADDRVVDHDHLGAGPAPVLAEASVRFTVPTGHGANKTVSDVHASAKEQRKSAAKHSAGEPDEEILLAEEETRDLKLRLARGHTLLVNDHPRVVVHAATRAALDAKITAVKAAYDDMGITATVMVDEQREGWLESLLCDQTRVDDLGHWRDAAAFTTSWFWGGSRVGSSRVDLPAIGYTTGSTQNLVRWLATESVQNSDAPVSVILGRTRRGKTTSMQLALLDVLLWPGHHDPWACLIDLKGDAQGIVDVAQAYDVPCLHLKVDDRHVAVLDACRTSAREHAVNHVVSQLSLLIPDALARQGQAILQRTASSVLLNDPDPWAHKVVAKLVQLGRGSTEGSIARELGETLAEATRSGFGALIAGNPGPNPVHLSAEPGLTVVTLPGLTLPAVGDAPTSWGAPERASVAALRGVLGWVTAVSASLEFRDRPKIVGVPEVHLLTATPDGRTFLTHTARMGAAFGLSLILDTQDAGGIESMSGLTEGIAAVFGFAQQTDTEQDALARLLGLPRNENSRTVIDELDLPTIDDLTRSDMDAHQPRRGHSLYRDRRGDVATIQWVVPSEAVASMLDTSATASAQRYRNARRDLEPLVDVDLARQDGHDDSENHKLVYAAAVAGQEAHA